MDKSLLKSKTFYVSLIVAIAPLFPAVSGFIAANPEAFSAILGGVFTVLRLITKDRVVIG
jgi:hypothetical protein